MVSRPSAHCRPATATRRRHVFTEVVDDAAVEARADWYARKVAKMPADGIVLAKEAFRLVEQLQAYEAEEVGSDLVHAYGTNLQFEDDEFDLVKVRAARGSKRAFELRDAYFHVPEPATPGSDAPGSDGPGAGAERKDDGWG